jgi:hypothetical protein
MFPPEQFTEQGSLSPGAPRVPPAPAGNILVIRPTSSSPTSYAHIPSAPWRSPISLQTKPFQLAVESCLTNVAAIAHFPQLPEITYDKFDADAERDDSLDLGWVGDKAPLNSKQMEFPLKYFGKRMGQSDFRTFNV